MERLPKFYLSFIFLVVLASCQDTKEKVAQAYTFGFSQYQGTPAHMNAFTYALELDSTKAETWRELSVTYLKRGIPHTWKDYYDEAVERNPVIWQPWRGYLYLWFYRDYEKAIDDFNASDTLTPNFIDAPQGHSVDYWRGIAYLGLKKYDSSLAYFNKYITTQIEESGEDWVEVTAFLYKGIAHFENNEPKKAVESLDKCIHYNSNKTADAKFYKALALQQLGQIDQAQIYIESALEDFKIGYYNERPYVEDIRQIYLEDLELLATKLNSK
jgi:tetratricopeptide (TPR) repeat protein